MTIWILLPVGCGILAYHQLPDWFPHGGHCGNTGGRAALRIVRLAVVERYDIEMTGGLGLPVVRMTKTVGGGI
jgi:hypothetical protein